MRIKSWNNLFFKTVQIKDHSNKPLETVTIGNQNSYSDCFLPKSNFIVKNHNLINKEKINNNIFVPSNVSINNYLLDKKNFLYGIPGSPNVTIGGAVAADTHGKEGYLGKSFGANIKTLYLKIATGEILKLDDQNNKEILEATVGGFGLTGHILGVEFKKNDLKYSETFLTEVRKGKGFDSLINIINAHDNSYFLIVLDLTNKGFRWVYKKAIPYKSKNFNKVTSFINKEIDLPLSFVGKNLLFSNNLLNFIYPYMQHSGLIHYSNFYYSQSGIRDVRNFCKNKKIIEVQFSIPMKNINQLSNLFLMINKFIKPITCSIKILGDDVNQNNLSFYQYGLSINFDFPMDRLNTKKLNEIYIEIIKLGGKVNLSKDSQISEEMFKSMYPEYPNWLKVVKKIDPFNYFQSAMSKRLQIK